MPAPSNPIFNRKVLKHAVEGLDFSTISDLEQKRQILAKWQQSIEAGKLKGAGEVALHGAFIGDLFASVLGYARMTDHPTEWTLTQEQKTDFDATTSDAALGFFNQQGSDIRAVIELKSADADLDAKQHRKNDKRSAVEQAFSYAPKSGKHCDWIIVSNYVELRLYHKSLMSEYESFRIAELGKDEEFRRFYALLACENLIAKQGGSVVDALYRKSEEEEKNISKRFYSEYTKARAHLFEHLKARNAEIDELLLLEKTQKLLDRFIFVCFCEDTGMLPERIFRKVVQHAQESLSFAEEKVWPELKGLFTAIDKGSPAHRIHAFNGELFKPDPQLDGLHIGDEIFSELADITDYDFDSDLNVNILGHIFEQSISDLEEIRAAIRGEQTDRKQGKRKKEGVFYTPEYITRYIVEQALGGWLEERQQELGFERLPELTQQDYASIKAVKSRFKGNRRIEQHRKFWEAYKERLMSVTVLDPACGSGAFLNQAFDFLHEEGKRVNAALAELNQGQSTVFDLNRHILSNNLYGVDLNRESVEITKLSLWLKTANKGSKLTALDDNIRCGNSLIDDPLIAGDKAFRWEDAFSDIMQRGGFDVVIGNPPYGAKLSEKEVKYLGSCFSSFEYQVNSYVLFYERGLELLCHDGFLGYITPATFTYQFYFKKLRNLIQQYEIISICKYVYEVFVDADVGDTVSWVMKKSIPTERQIVLNICNDSSMLVMNSFSKSSTDITNQDGTYRLNADGISIQQIYQNSIKLVDISQIIVGIKPYQTGKGTPKQTREVVKEKIFTSNSSLDDTYKLCVIGKDFHRYTFLRSPTMFLSYGEWLAEPRQTAPFFEDKIILRQTSDSLIAHLDTSKAINLNNVYNIGQLSERFSIKYILSLINSRLMNFVYQMISQEKGRVFAEVKKIYLAQLPIAIIDISDQKPFIEKVDTMLELNKQFHEGAQKFLRFIESTYHPKSLSKKLQAFYSLEFGDFVKELKKQKVKLSKQDEFELMDLFEAQKKQALGLQQIEQTDREIDRMVYELYELTEEEIRMVEGSSL